MRTRWVRSVYSTIYHCWLKAGEDGSFPYFLSVAFNVWWWRRRLGQKVKQRKNMSVIAGICTCGHKSWSLMLNIYFFFGLSWQRGTGHRESERGQHTAQGPQVGIILLHWGHSLCMLGAGTHTHTYSQSQFNALWIWGILWHLMDRKLYYSLYSQWLVWSYFWNTRVMSETHGVLSCERVCMVTN